MFRLVDHGAHCHRARIGCHFLSQALLELRAGRPTDSIACRVHLWCARFGRGHGVTCKVSVWGPRLKSRPPLHDGPTGTTHRIRDASTGPSQPHTTALCTRSCFARPGNRRCHSTKNPRILKYRESLNTLIHEFKLN